MFHMMPMNFLIFTFWFLTGGIGGNTLSVGVIYHASLMGFHPNMTINVSNCDQCLCQMFNSSMSSLNCLTNNDVDVICQMFSDGIYLGLNASPMRINLSSTFYYRLKDQSMITTTQMRTSALATTGKDITTTSTTPVCSSSGHGTLSFLSLTTPSSWTQYSYNYTASSTTLTVMFGFQTEPARRYYLDDISVADVNAPNIQLLNNPSFENLTTNLTSWTLWCASSCTGTGGKLYTNSPCHLSTGICFGANCYGSNAIIFLSQSFPTIIGHIYTISYWLVASGGFLPVDHFYFDVY